MIEHVKNEPAPGLDGLPQKWRDEWDSPGSDHLLPKDYRACRSLAKRHARELEIALKTPKVTADQINAALAYFGDLAEYKSAVLEDIICELQGELDNRYPYCIHCDGHNTKIDAYCEEWWCLDCGDWAKIK